MSAEGQPLISIIVVSYNTKVLTLGCIESIIQASRGLSFEVIVVDNNSSDGSADAIASMYQSVKLIRLARNEGFSRGNNVGIATARGLHMFLLNSDTLVTREALLCIGKEAAAGRLGVFAPALINPDGSIQRNWFDFPSPVRVFLRFVNATRLVQRISRLKLIVAWSRRLRKTPPAFFRAPPTSGEQIDYASFAAVVIPRSTIDSVGGLDEELFFYQEDCEFALRARREGYTIRYLAEAKITHFGGASSSGVASKQAYRNDICGVLHVFSKHYRYYEFLLTQIGLLIAVSIQYFRAVMRLRDLRQGSPLYADGRGKREYEIDTQFVRQLIGVIARWKYKRSTRMDRTS